MHGSVEFMVCYNIPSGLANDSILAKLHAIRCNRKFDILLSHVCCFSGTFFTQFIDSARQQQQTIAKCDDQRQCSASAMRTGRIKFHQLTSFEAFLVVGSVPRSMFGFSPFL